jgi:CRP-like cAMP-binding protein
MDSTPDAHSVVFDPQELIELNTPLLANVPEDAWPEILSLGSRVHMDAGQAVYQQDEPGGDLLVLLTGSVVVGVVARSGEIQLAELGPGAVLGELSFLLGGNRSASVRTTVPSTFLRFTNQAFQQLLSSHSPAAFQVLYNVARSVAGRLKAADMLVRELALRPEIPSPDLVRLHTAIFTDAHLI